MAKKRLGFTDKQLKQIRVTVGRNLAAARKNAGMTQAEVMRIVWNVDNIVLLYMANNSISCVITFPLGLAYHDWSEIAKKCYPV